MKIPILRIPFDDDDLSFVRQGVTAVLESGALTMGRFTREFEEAFAAFCGTRYAVAVSNGTTALEVVLRALDVHGGSVVVPTNTFLATALAVMHAGNRVIFADSDPATFALDPDDVERRIRDDTRAVVTVHIGGLVSPDTARLAARCRARGLHLIEDCAHAHGSSLGSRRAGSLGVAGTFSFFPTKVLVTGEGGMITTDDEEVYRAALRIRNHGKDPAAGNRMTDFGSNYRLSELTAVLGVQQMRKAAWIIEERRRVAAMYDAALAPHGDLLRPVVPAPGTESTYYKYIVYLAPGLDRSALKVTLGERHGVALTGEVYADLCHTEPLWERTDAGGAPLQPSTDPARRIDQTECFPGASRIAAEHVCLPLYPGLTQADVHHVVDAVTRVAQEQLSPTA